MIKEYTYPDGIVDFYGNTSGDPITINLRYVMSAFPWSDGKHTQVQLMGCPSYNLIDEPYERFIRDWRCTKGT